ncbi:MAG: hypothetical protein N2Z63_02355 [Thiobacillaceae bacterium]|nr:hypothetical protein [Thiobacillaceae bacterium]MDW8324607.1 hypothetical protein [Burkholderiales bacterium]
MDPISSLVFDRLLAGQPGAAARLARHAGRRVCLRLPGFTLAIVIRDDGGLAPTGSTAGCDCSLELSPGVLAALPLLGAQAVRAVRVTGDATLAADLAAVLARFDWAVALAPWLGPVLAARVDRALRGFAAWAEQARLSLALTAAEYLVHEARLIAPAAAVRDFVHAVDELREATDRLEARLALLERRQGRS